MAPYSAVAAGSRSGFTRLGTAASDAGLNRPVPTPASRASPTVAAKLSTSAMPRNATPRTRSESDQAVPPRPPIGGGPEHGAEQHGRHEIGEQDEADRPRRVEALIGDDEERDVGGAVAQRRLGREPRSRRGRRARVEVDRGCGALRKTRGIERQRAAPYRREPVCQIILLTILSDGMPSGFLPVPRPILQRFQLRNMRNLRPTIARCAAECQPFLQLVVQKVSKTDRFRLSDRV